MRNTEFTQSGVLQQNEKSGGTDTPAAYQESISRLPFTMFCCQSWTALPLRNFSLQPKYSLNPVHGNKFRPRLERVN
jgi:hypothetical protein